MPDRPTTGSNNGDADPTASPPSSNPAKQSAACDGPAWCDLLIALLCTATLCMAALPVSIEAAATRSAGDAAGESSMLIMVHIRASSPGGLKQLRAMPIDIIRVRSEVNQAADKPSLDDSVIVEAVIPRNFLPKLKAAGYDVRIIPPN